MRSSFKSKYYKYYFSVDELQLAIEEIQKNEKELKSILQVCEFLFENREELQFKLETEQQNIED